MQGTDHMVVRGVYVVASISWSSIVGEDMRMKRHSSKQRVD